MLYRNTGQVKYRCFVSMLSVPSHHLKMPGGIRSRVFIDPRTSINALKSAASHDTGKVSDATSVTTSQCIRLGLARGLLRKRHSSGHQRSGESASTR
jgi:hypothetical protein